MKAIIHRMYVLHLSWAERAMDLEEPQLGRAIIAARQALNIHPDSLHAQAILDEARIALSDRPR